VSFLHKAIVTIYSQVVHQPPGIRGFWFGVLLVIRYCSYTVYKYKFPVPSQHFSFSLRPSRITPGRINTTYLQELISNADLSELTLSTYPVYQQHAALQPVQTCARVSRIGALFTFYTHEINLF